jgi:hypothetical protein
MYFKEGGVKVNRDKLKLYINMSIGTIGTVLLALASIKYSLEIDNNSGYIMIFIGFLLTINYIDFLEKKAGIIKKFTWIRSIVSIILFLALSYLFIFN